MAQTPNGLSFTDVAFFFQVEGDAQPTDASGFITEISVDGYELQVGETYTGQGTGAIMTAGKISPAEVTAKVVYTEIAADPSDKLWAAKTQKKRVKYLWYPKGKTTGSWEWATDYGYLTSMTPPSGGMDKADAVLVEATVKCGTISKNLVP